MKERAPGATRALGQLGEDLAARHLEGLGYRLLGRNVRSSLGELDLVFRERDEVVFVEVKARRSLLGIAPEEKVDRRKIERLARLAEAYLAERGLEESAWRIDVVAVVLDAQGRVQRLQHYKYAVY
ncbi:MAG: YraN family protein [Chloroflexi bacterium]|nr:YraN family protein [Chloroflexota bacterium]